MIQPILSNVLVKPFLGDEKTKGGIIVPENVRGESDKCTIVAVGKGTKNKPMSLKAGMTGFRVHEWGTPVIDNGELYYIMDESAIIATT